MKKDNFNLIICGVGGQGQITLLRILSEASLMEGKNFVGAETHGLSQRGGSVEVHFRMGKVFSPLVPQLCADLIFSLEMQETLRAMYYCNKNTVVLINKKIIPIVGEENLKQEEVLSQIKKFTKNIKIVEASRICQEKFKKEILAGVYLLGYAQGKKILPLKEKFLKEAIKRVIPQKYLEINLKAFDLGRKLKDD
ncbi:MAG: indolepyruvate oxidoreductase subunit beta [Candidatus Pacebacteria bacterium]|nr:indolepyruvate oxidoreductase subunit beta [Candidatus Paceibacterota bacterium]